MSFRHYYIFVLILLSLLVGCNHTNSHTSKSADKLAEQTDSNDDCYWAPKEFKKKHYDEWVVVEQSIKIRQCNPDAVDFCKIDELVRQYVRTKNIALPADKYLRINEIEKICKEKFDISDYDYSNFGMHIADGTARLFESYVNWLLFNEVKKKRTGINLKKEQQEVDLVMTAFENCCDATGDFGGSGGWIGYSDVIRIENRFLQSMYKAILKPETHKSLPFLLTPEHFKVECGIECDEVSTPQTVMESYYIAMKRWLEYRAKAEKSISNSTIRKEYGYLTRMFAREHYIHLKNGFGDIGMCSASMYDECYLHLDCSDEEMLNYSFEKAYNI